MCLSKFFSSLFLLLSLHIGYASNQGPNTLIIECPPTVNLTEGSKFDTSITGYPKTLQSTGGTTSITYIEIYQKGDCKNREDAVTRIFTVTNQIGEQQRCTQSIFLKHRSVNDFYIPVDTAISYPTDNSLTSKLINFKLNQGSVDISFKDSLLSPNCVGTTVKVRRTWTLTDKCSNTVRKVNSILNVQAYGNSFIQTVNLLDGVCNSEGYINLTATGEFSPYNYEWTTGLKSNNITNLLPGVYQVSIADRFNCKQTLTYNIYSMAERADIGGRVATTNGYRVIPDSVKLDKPDQIVYGCFSKNGGLQYGMLVSKKQPASYGYRFRKVTDAQAGVSTKDIILIQKQILNVLPFKDTLLFFAADVNKSYTITSSDIVEIRKIILGVKLNFSLVDPWYFIRTDWKDVIKPYQTLESITFKGVDVNVFPKTTADVIALKLGDIDFSYRDQGLKDLDTRISSNGNVNLIIGNYTKNNLIPCFLKSNEQIQGLQFSLEADGISISDIVDSQLPEEAFHITADGKLNVSWSTGENLHWNSNKALFYLKMQNRINPLQIKINDNLNAEYYDQELNARKFDVQYEFFQELLSKEKLLVFPNPVENEIHILTPANDLKECKIYNPSGKLIYSTHHSNNILLDVQDWLNGIYYYDAELKDGNKKSGSFIVKH